MCPKAQPKIVYAKINGQRDIQHPTMLWMCKHTRLSFCVNVHCVVAAYACCTIWADQENKGKK